MSAELQQKPSLPKVGNDLSELQKLRAPATPSSTRVVFPKGTEAEASRTESRLLDPANAARMGLERLAIDSSHLDRDVAMKIADGTKRVASILRIDAECIREQEGPGATRLATQRTQQAGAIEALGKQIRRACSNGDEPPSL
ncbi:MAG: hypothetical protein KDD69_09745 [Bdellovibrionales bacterium]|nr:hypothetical protein [Bdellovibrionales bacterium]